MSELLAERQLDKTLEPWRALPRSPPSGGWLRAVRQALGMTTRQLARALNVTQAAVADAERAEAKSAITLATLQRYAAALDCEVVYALVPRRPLQQVVHERAARIAHDELARVRHSLTLEGQADGGEYMERQIAQLRAKLLEGKRSRLWR